MVFPITTLTVSVSVAPGGTATPSPAQNERDGRLEIIPEDEDEHKYSSAGNIFTFWDFIGNAVLNRKQITTRLHDHFNYSELSECGQTFSFNEHLKHFSSCCRLTPDQTDDSHGYVMVMKYCFREKMLLSSLMKTGCSKLISWGWWFLKAVRKFHLFVFSGNS